MPEFIPQHIPAGTSPDFLVGYMAAIEWTGLQDQMPDEPDYIDRDKIRGWSVDARKRMRKECDAFIKANAADLAIYCALREPEMTGGYTAMECAGHDFYLTRTGSGTGFWDRGDDPVFERLSKACGRTEINVWMSRGWLRLD
jgi:hypothetical protein